MLFIHSLLSPNSGDPCFDEAIIGEEDGGTGHGNPNRTVSELHMDNCTELETYNFFAYSQVSFALTFLAAGLWVVGEFVVKLDLH